MKTITEPTDLQNPLFLRNSEICCTSLCNQWFKAFTMLAVRVALLLIAAGLTFIPTYNKIGQSTGDSWVPYFLAFQNGFFKPSVLSMAGGGS